MFQPLSKERYDGKCAAKHQTPQILKKVFKLIAGDESEFLKIMSEALVKISDNKDLIKYGEKVFNMKFGKKQRTQLSGEVGLTKDKFMEVVERIDKAERLKEKENDKQEI